MAFAVTSDIKVNAESFFQAERSRPVNNEFLFLYRIKIENTSNYTAQLLSRKWVITDAFGVERIVEGKGVVGETPIIQPGESFEYVSFCPLNTEMGKMEGHFIMERQVDQYQFSVQVPALNLLAPIKLN